MRCISIVILAAVACSGCCAFGPCDRLATLGGRVVSISGEPISSASVEFLGMRTTTNAHGCFDLDGLYRQPYSLVVNAADFKPLSTPAKSGSFQVQVVLAPLTSSQVGEVQWSKLPVSSVPEMPGCP